MTRVSTRIDGFVLAGGASSRMGTDKSRLFLGGETLVQRAGSALSAVAERVFVVGGSASDVGGLPVIPDDPNANGPHGRASIIGLYTAVKAADTEWAAVLPCDLPFITGALVDRLVSFTAADVDAVVPVQPDRRLQPLCALYRREACLPIVEDMLKIGDRKLQNLLNRVRTRIVDFEEIDDLPHSQLFFTNVNTPEEYAAAQAIACRKPTK